MRGLLPVHLMVAVAGMAALSWELLWQILSSLSLGVSALGTAITLAATMGGMTVGALAAGRVLSGREVARPLRVYGALELVIGLSGLLLLAPGLALVERIDAVVWRSSPSLAPAVHVLGIALVLGPPTVAMGATVPVFGLIARRHGGSIAVLYALNTAGAAAGVLVMAILVVPALGVSLTVGLVASLNLAVGALALRLRPAVVEAEPPAPEAAPEPAEPAGPPAFPWPAAIATVAVTGLATFVLEVAWFRSMRAAFQATSESFAIMLAAVLVPLAAAARLAPWLRRRGVGPGPLLAAAGAAVLLAGPLIERLDLLDDFPFERYFPVMLGRFGLALVVIGPAVLLLGTALPWLLEAHHGPRRWAALYATNTAGAIAGALLAAWVLLPSIGFARTSWAVGVLLGLTALAVAGKRARIVGAPALVVALAVAVLAESGVGRLRVQLGQREHRVLACEEAPDATVAAVAIEEASGPVNALVIDGFVAAGEYGTADYMAWMGRLPMLAHPDPKRALVICFGTGQTANAVREEGVPALDIVDISGAVFRMAEHFPTNRGVLEDERARAIVMDGRAWLRRTDELYDVITLEPMPPYFAGSNALYSREFYELIASRLRPGGIAAQWVPYHLLGPLYATSTVSTFHEVFPDSILWMDPSSTTGVVLGRLGSGDDPPAGAWSWPGFERPATGRALDRAAVERAVWLDPAGVARYASAFGVSITDDNQLLSYGAAQRAVFDENRVEMQVKNLLAIQQAAGRELPLPGTKAGDGR